MKTSQAERQAEIVSHALKKAPWWARAVWRLMLVPHAVGFHWPFVMRLPGYNSGEVQCLCQHCGAMGVEYGRYRWRRRHG